MQQYSTYFINLIKVYITHNNKENKKKRGQHTSYYIMYYVKLIEKNICFIIIYLNEESVQQAINKSIYNNRNSLQFIAVSSRVEYTTVQCNVVSNKTL